MAASAVIGALFLLIGKVSLSLPCGGAYYRELNCTAAVMKGGCAESYSCPVWYPRTNKCYYLGVEYSHEEQIPSDVTGNSCSVACRCNANQDGQARSAVFNCASIDCAVDIDSMDAEENCISVYDEIDNCCPSNKVCGNDIDVLSTCSVDGTLYREGEKYYPNNACLECICTKDFDGKFEGEASCIDIDCGVEIQAQENLANKCAPVLTEWNSCCPNMWQCPDNVTKIDRSETTSLIKETCTFGDYTLNVGDTASVTDRCVQCSCKIPPLLSCVQVKDCDSDSSSS